ncbi:MAG: rod shape-determining protein MreC [Halothiobacillaceae bacterium]|nr:rod shape-determining protein MreC [Halothiobacillaceae bacterium]HER34950.1 rod shape-determining protein MreC [Halothiobacillaceae bacterium]
MALFDTHRPGFNRLLLLVVVSVILMSLDRIGTRWVGQLDRGLGSITDGIIETIGQPLTMVDSLGRWFTDRTDLHTELDRLREENTLLRGQMQQFVSLKREVDELRSLLDGRASDVPAVLLTRRIGHPPTPSANLFTIGRGFTDDVRPGDPVIDAHGIVGQVLRSTATGATVIELTSRDHMLSVVLGQTGRTALLRGTGTERLVAKRVPERTKVQAGDLLTTSGIDRAFPRGYPVARVTAIETDEAQGFIRVIAEPVADLARLDYVLVVTKPPDAPEEAPSGETSTLTRPALEDPTPTTSDETGNGN